MLNQQKFLQGDICLANLNPSKNSEPGKTRPVLIIQNQTLLDIGHSTTIIIPLTTRLINNAFPLRIRIAAKSKLEKDSDLLIDQIRAIDNNRFIGKALLNIGSTKILEVNQAITQILEFTSSLVL